MMILEQIRKIESTPAKLREFAFVVGGVLCVLGSLLAWKGRSIFPWLLLPGFVLVLLGVVLPGVLKPFQKVWMTLAILIGWMTGRIVLFFLFYGVLTPIGVILRFKNKKLLNCRPDRSQKSYWNVRTQKFSPHEAERQF